MRHPTEGVLRRLLDEPAGVADADRRHVTDCPHCLGVLTATREDAELVGASLATGTEQHLDLDAAWQRLTAAAPAPAARPAAAARPKRSSEWLRRPAAAVAAVALVLTGAGTAAANDWLQIFRTEQVAPVSITTADLVALPDLSAYGELDVEGSPDVRSVPDAEAAAAQSGLDVPEVAQLPGGVTGKPIYQVVGEVSATFTFSAERAARATAETGEPLPAVPPGVDGSSVRLVAGPGVAQIWTSTSGTPALVVGRAIAPTAFASGASFEVVRDYLLSLPGLPDDLADQLRTFAADGSTLPIPVPADEVTTTSAEVGGVPATVIATRDRTLAAVIWVEDGIVTVVAGALDDSEVLEIARDLR
jgi:hypothetical protein